MGVTSCIDLASIQPKYRSNFTQTPFGSSYIIRCPHGFQFHKNPQTLHRVYGDFNLIIEVINLAKFFDLDKSSKTQRCQYSLEYFRISDIDFQFLTIVFDRCMFGIKMFIVKENLTITPSNTYPLKWKFRRHEGPVLRL